MKAGDFLSEALTKNFEKCNYLVIRSMMRIGDCFPAYGGVAKTQCNTSIGRLCEGMK